MGGKLDLLRLIAWPSHYAEVGGKQGVGWVGAQQNQEQSPRLSGQIMR